MDVLLPFFRTNLSRNHLDVGVATGYFPATALKLESDSISRTDSFDGPQHITLVDIVDSSLETAKARIQKAAPGTEIQCVQADVTAPLPEALRGLKFDSISMFNLFHCVPGGPRKMVAFRTYSQVLSSTGTLYGCTLLANYYAPNWFARQWALLFERQGAFHCWHDTKEMYDEALREAFEESETWVVGYMLLFKAKGPLQKNGRSMQDWNEYSAGYERKTT